MIETKDKSREKLREYNRMNKRKSRLNPEVKAREIAWRERPESIAHLKAYRKIWGQQEWVKEKARKRQNLRYATDPDFRKKRMEYQRHRMRGMSPQMFEALMKLQDGKCAICQCVLKGGKHIHADHCHDTDKPRGLLCTYCNLIEGMITNVNLSPLEFGQRLHNYLSKPPASQIS